MTEIMEINELKHLDGKLVVFDLDGTLLEGDLGEAIFFLLIIIKALGYTFDDLETIFNQLNKQRVISGVDKPELIRLLKSYFSFLGKGNFVEAYQVTAEYYLRFSKIEIYKLAEWVLQNRLDQFHIKLLLGENEFPLHIHARQDPMMSSLMKHMYMEGADIMIISASPQWSVEAFCSFEGVPLTFAHGAKKEQNGMIDVPYGTRKLEILRSNGAWPPFMVFGNSQGDIEMLEAAVHPIVRKTSQEQLLEKAVELCWQII